MSEKVEPKTTYRVRNWKAYNKALIQRGSLTLWISEDVLSSWVNTEKTGHRGRSNTYADTAIECMLLIQSVFRLPLRQTQGFLMSILGLMAFALPVPMYSTLSRRRSGLDVRLPRQKRSQGIYVVIDSTGFKVFGYGEWHMRKHHLNKDGSERKKPRLWRKVHFAVDEATHEIIAVVTTESNTHDKTMLPDLLGQIDEPVIKVGCDKGYDYVSCYEDITAVGAEPVIPPRRNAIVNEGWNMLTKRNHAIRRIEEVGREEWKKETNYHRRSVAETAVFRLKIIFGSSLRSRILENQSAETRLRCKALNIMTYLGMPDSYPVTAAS
ncbi:MAG: IS5 family transposase [Chloroflexi bacterium]|nr:IS5 family transposase [Chloroflexota bacterium]